jgi:3-phosphoshikimate 1-carboxyvinyltransferase
VTSFAPTGPLSGSLRAPPDKSISHRAAILGAMSEGKTIIRGYLDAADTRSTLDAVEAAGAGVASESSAPGALTVAIAGAGLRGAVPASIDVGNSGTLMRMLPGWLAGQPGGKWTLDGDDSIRRRPVDRVAEPLKRMGAKVSSRKGLPPLKVSGSPLHGISYELPVASAQVKSCLLLAALLADGPTEIVEPQATRDHTERMLSSAGAHIVNAARSVAIQPAESIELGEFRVPGDFSSAAFFIAAALLVDGSEVAIRNVGVNRTRIGFLNIAQRMGAQVEIEDERDEGGEPTATLVVSSSGLRATEVGAAEVPLAIDELPLVALLGCFAEGETVVSGAEELRHKETDRIATVVAGLRAIGADVEPLADGFAVRGAERLRGGVLDSHGDHRLAMLGAVAGLASRDGVEVEGMDAAAVSYPEFERDLRSLVL